MKPGASALAREEEADDDSSAAPEALASAASAEPDEGEGEGGVYEPEEKGVDPGTSVSCTYCCKMRRCAGVKDLSPKRRSINDTRP